MNVKPRDAHMLSDCELIESDVGFLISAKFHFLKFVMLRSYHKLLWRRVCEMNY